MERNQTTRVDVYQPPAHPLQLHQALLIAEPIPLPLPELGGKLQVLERPLEVAERHMGLAKQLEDSGIQPIADRQRLIEQVLGAIRI